MNTVGKLIQQTRKQNNLNQKKFGETLTVGQSYISKVEQGEETPTPMFIKLFCLLYSVDEKILKD